MPASSATSAKTRTDDLRAISHLPPREARPTGEAGPIRLPAKPALFTGFVAIDFLIAATVASVRNATIFLPFSIVFAIGASGTPLITNLPAFCRSGMRMASVSTVAMIAEM